MRDVPIGECIGLALGNGNASVPVPRDEGMGQSKGFLDRLFLIHTINEPEQTGNFREK